MPPLIGHNTVTIDRQIKLQVKSKPYRIFCLSGVWTLQSSICTGAPVWGVEASTRRLCQWQCQCLLPYALKRDSWSYAKYRFIYNKLLSTYLLILAYKVHLNSVNCITLVVDNAKYTDVCTWTANAEPKINSAWTLDYYSTCSCTEGGWRLEMANWRRAFGN